MPRNKPVYERGLLATTVKDIVSKYTDEIYYAPEVLKQVKIILPEAKDNSIRSLLTYEYPRRGWAVETGVYDEYQLTEKFNTRVRKEPSQKTILAKGPDDELTFVEIGRAMVAYINELKTLADIAEEDNVRLTKQVNDLQDAYNTVKTNGAGVSVKDILKR